jgi:arylsulfatase A-like enzyme
MKIFVFLILLAPHLLTAEKPNILWISIDDLNDWVGYLKGHPQVKTPNIDRLTQKGISFTNAHCSTPLCKPSRTALLTGLREKKTGVYSNGSKFNPTEYTLLPQHFGSNGYTTYGTGKIHHSKINSNVFQKAFNTQQRWSPFTNEQSLYTKKELKTKGTDQPAHLIKNGPGGRDYTLPFNRMPSERAPNKISGESFDWAPFDLEDDDFGDGLITTWALEQLKQHDATQPFFMGVGYYRPHIPLYAPKKYFDLYPLETLKLPPNKKNDLDDIPEAGKLRALTAVTAGTHQHTVKYGEWKKAVQAYLACVSFVDAQIGKLLDYLEQSPYADNTIIVLFSDHGWHLGEKDAWGKFTGWIHSTRVPLIICPAGTNKGTLCDEPVSLLDLYPTLVELTHLPKLELDGTSIVPLLKNPHLNTNRIVRTQIDKNNFSLINKEWHYIEYHDGSSELYNRKKDPLEYTNLSGNKEYTTIIKMMKAISP